MDSEREADHFDKLRRAYVTAPCNRIYQPIIRIERGRCRIEIEAGEELHHAAGAVHAPMDSVPAAEDGFGAAMKAVGFDDRSLPVGDEGQPIANFGSLGILIGGLSTMVPERRDEVVGLGLRSIFAGTLATCCTGAVVGILTP